MKKLFLFLSLTLLAIQWANAMPAKRGQWRTMKLSDGTEVRVELRGDEHFHYFAAADGQLYALSQADGETVEPITAEQCGQTMAKARRARKAKSQAKRRKMTHYTGQKKGIIILVQYTDVSFKEGHDRDLYEQIANGEGFTSSDGFVGSVRDYFKDQSRGLFDLTFDIYGPLTLANERSYYGGNDSYGEDKKPEEMLTERLINRGLTSGRADDNAETIKKRLNVYNEQTAPLIAWYEKEGLRHSVKGYGELAEINAALCAIIDNL